METPAVAATATARPRLAYAVTLPGVVDWGTLTPTLRTGDLVCRRHGRVRPKASVPVPSCPSCGAMLSRVDRRGPDAAPRFVEPAPAYCAGPGRHRLTGGAVLVGWHGCPCPAAAAHRGGHRAWTCGAVVGAEPGRRSVVCGDVQLWPPCTA